MSDEPKNHHFFYNSTFNTNDNHDESSIYNYNNRVSPVSSAFDPSSYMSFTDCLHTSSSMDYGSLEKAFGLSSSSSFEGSRKTGDLGGSSSEILTTSTPNSSIISSSNSSEAGIEEDSDKIKKEEDQKPPKDSEDGGESSKKVKAKKKGEKKQKEPRVAFMTKSEIDHLEDGYRWRKYGQKAVKNSPYPRSYYRCTTQKCTVKKRVERSYQDPSLVITTYEGQHNHPLPTNLRGSSTAGFFSPSMLATTPMMGAAAASPSFPHDFLMQINQGRLNYGQGGAGGTVFAQNVSPFHQQQHNQVPDHGLLQDVIPNPFFKHEP